MARDNTGSDVPRGEGGKWLPGQSPNPGGKPKKLREIEAMLDDEHRTVDNMREVFTRLKGLALDDRVETFMTKKGDVVENVKPPDPAFLRLYLDRVLGPVRDVEDIPELRDAPPEVLEWLRNN